jgi:hypothetical protein
LQHEAALIGRAGAIAANAVAPAPSFESGMVPFRMIDHNA